MQLFQYLPQEKIKISLHLLLLSIIGLSLMLRFADTAGFFMYINMLVSISFLAYHLAHKNYALTTAALKLAILPITLLSLSLIAKGYIDYKHDAKNLVQAYWIVVSILLLTHYNQTLVISLSNQLVKSILGIFTAVQLFALAIGWDAFGTTTNPHYLALHCAFTFCISLFYYFYTTEKSRLLFLVIALLQLPIILYTSSRPVWIGLILSVSFIFAHLDKKNWIKFAVIFVGLQFILIYLNTFNYKSRFFDLIYHITTEERVAIWRDTWTMQKASDLAHWIYGHGLSSFYEAFKQYSSYHPSHDFRSPHNLLLEILFSSGLIGIASVTFLYYLLYRNSLKLKNKKNQRTLVGTLILSLTTVSLILNGLNWSFHSSSSIYPIAYIAGVLVYMHLPYSKQKITQSYQ